jgi:serine/threonine protein kinase
MAGANGQMPDVGGTVRELPGYRLERQLGWGSTGVVYLAEDLQLRRKVALKILAPTLADDELFRGRFDRESQSAANLDHPNIVPVYAAGEAAGSLYIAMRYVGGGDLRTRLEANGALSLEQATSIIASVADALDAAHAQGMIHRDVKPANILIDDRNGQDHYYLSDFGITKIVSSDRDLTSTGQIVGTIDYIAPEQIQGKPMDGRADLYALGCVLYQCLTGVVPFIPEETAALMWAHVHDEPPSVTAQRPDLPPQIDNIVAKAMAKQPEDRYATCRELALTLRAVAADPAASLGSGEIFPARPVNTPSPVPAGMTSTYTPPTPARVRAPVTASPSQRNWLYLILGGVLALALVAGSTVAVLKYLSSRFPNTAEHALLDQVPLALTMKNSCTRDVDVDQDAANVQASVICTSEGDVNRVVFTQFTSAEILDAHYRAAVATAPIGQSPGDCRSAERAAGEYTSESGDASGRVLCYQRRGSSFIEWTDEGHKTLGVATRADPDYTKLRGWWAGVVGEKLPTPEPSQAPPPPAPVSSAAPGADTGGLGAAAEEPRRQADPPQAQPPAPPPPPAAQPPAPSPPPATQPPSAQPQPPPSPPTPTHWQEPSTLDSTYHCGAYTKKPTVWFQECVKVFPTPSGAYVQSLLTVSNPSSSARPVDGETRAFLGQAELSKAICGHAIVAAHGRLWCFSSTKLVVGHGRDVLGRGLFSANKPQLNVVSPIVKT